MLKNDINVDPPEVHSMLGIIDAVLILTGKWNFRSRASVSDEDKEAYTMGILSVNESEWKAGITAVKRSIFRSNEVVSKLVCWSKS